MPSCARLSEADQWALAYFAFPFPTATMNVMQGHFVGNMAGASHGRSEIGKVESTIRGRPGRASRC
jgi:hypothetical protein